MKRRSKAKASSNSKSADHRASPSAQKIDDSSDLEALKQFCSGISITEVSFERWSESHSCLDLTLPIFLSAQEAREGCKRILSFSRMMIVKAQSESSPSRQTRTKCCHEVEVPPDSQNGQSITIAGLGDQREDRCGNLHIVIRIR